MAIKKSELYSSLWASCDELRGSMDASQYKDYVLVMLFMKYVSDRKDPLIEIPAGTSFYDMLKHRGKSDIGDQINKIIGEFAKVNGLTGIITEADFDDSAKLGSGKDKIDLLTNLLNIFNKPELDFSKNRAEGDDLLGDAYEYLMRHFATESGKSKGQFYTPAEVSRIMAQVIGINKSVSQDQTIYDPTCGSGSLLLKASDLAPHGITIYGQENDNATRALAVMNMWLHNFSDADIQQGNTMASPLFTDETTGELKQFDFAVANPPFSYKKWMNGLDPQNDVYKRFEGYDAIPPKKNGDFAFLLHLIKSLKSKGKACIVLPLGVLFRGNSEGEIRKKILQKGYIKGIIGLPPNLFYGTGIAASLIVIDKEGADKRESIFMIDASRGFIKDGNKNRLREQDIYKIVDTFNNKITADPKYAREIPFPEISGKKNVFNLNLPRYIDSQEAEDIQDIEAHLLGGIPKRDIEALKEYWTVYPSLKEHLFEVIAERPEYYQLNIENEEIKNEIFTHPEFTAFSEEMNEVFEKWKIETVTYTKAFEQGIKPKKEIRKISKNLLEYYNNKPLTDKYTMFQHLMDYWAETMQDDFYELAADGWKAGNEVIRKEKKTKRAGKEVSKPIAGIEGLEGRLIPPTLIISEYFASDQKAIDDLEAKAETLNAEMEEMREENGGEDGLLTNAMDDKGKISKANLTKAIKELGRRNEDNAEEFDILKSYKKLMDEEKVVKDKIKIAKEKLEKKVIAQYPKLSIVEIKALVVDKKWMAEMKNRIRTEMDNISHRLTQRIKELAERYELPMPKLSNDVDDFTTKVENHLKEMNFKW
ncbi:class I SAM-dependent DNA methyltransferase [Marinifilum fragile]|uniref:type I restriction-modification system subunit M n=1 Tax=Marinifilum fragile TaxID=570161 RepID=UPI002AA5F6C3|nr:class I SAM-dependent DNA methyltransferase [Marinifilum fragile]